MSVNSSNTKRSRSNSLDSLDFNQDSSRELPPAKKSRQYDIPIAHLTRLSDELLVRIASFLDTTDLASFQRVSRRCQRIAIDSQVWRILFHRRFSPRSRVQVLKPPTSTLSGSRSDNSNYQFTDWKGLYKLRHNWSTGSCGIREIDITTTESARQPGPSSPSPSDDASVKAQESSSAPTSFSSPKPSTLVKLHEVRGYPFLPLRISLRGRMIVVAIRHS